VRPRARATWFAQAGGAAGWTPLVEADALAVETGLAALTASAELPLRILLPSGAHDALVFAPDHVRRIDRSWAGRVANLLAVVSLARAPPLVRSVHTWTDGVRMRVWMGLAAGKGGRTAAPRLAQRGRRPARGGQGPIRRGRSCDPGGARHWANAAGRALLGRRAWAPGERRAGGAALLNVRVRARRWTACKGRQRRWRTCSAPRRTGAPACSFCLCSGAAPKPCVLRVPEPSRPPWLCD
jgi:hypothetical protein